MIQRKKNRQGNDIGTQYRSLILFNDQSEEMLSIELKDEYQILLRKEGYGDIVTDIKKLKKFYPAEEYHQDYLVKNPNGYCPDHSTGIVFKEVEKPKIDNSYLLAGKYSLVLDSEFCPYCTKLKNEVLSDYEGSIPLHFRYSSELHDLQLSSPTWATPTIFLLKMELRNFLFKDLCKEKTSIRLLVFLN
jgi:peptide methionine sulfoxide reductase msrA/msrB